MKIDKEGVYRTRGGEFVRVKKGTDRRPWFENADLVRFWDSDGRHGYCSVIDCDFNLTHYVCPLNSIAPPEVHWKYREMGYRIREVGEANKASDWLNSKSNKPGRLGMLAADSQGIYLTDYVVRDDDAYYVLEPLAKPSPPIVGTCKACGGDRMHRDCVCSECVRSSLPAEMENHLRLTHLKEEITEIRAEIAGFIDRCKFFFQDESLNDLHLIQEKIRGLVTTDKQPSSPESVNFLVGNWSQKTAWENVWELLQTYGMNNDFPSGLSAMEWAIRFITKLKTDRDQYHQNWLSLQEATGEQCLLQAIERVKQWRAEDALRDSMLADEPGPSPPMESSVTPIPEPQASHGKFLKQFRLKAQKGLREFADLIGVLPSELCKFENGQKTLDDLFKHKTEQPAIPEGFTPWHGGDCPVDGKTKVDYLMRCDDDCDFTPDVEAGELDWDHEGTDYDIIAYRVIDQPQPEPWQPVAGETCSYEGTKCLIIGNDIDGDWVIQDIEKEDLKPAFAHHLSPWIDPPHAVAEFELNGDKYRAERWGKDEPVYKKVEG